MTLETPTPIKLRTNIFRGCQRCGGTLRLERDLDSRLDETDIHYTCLQCGRHTPLVAVIAQMQAKAAERAA